MSNNQQAFSLLSAGMRKWVAKQGWSGFRPMQSEAIVKLLSAEQMPNAVISAATASGKTEAAFLPALSVLERHYEENKQDRFCSMLYIAPLKALINDQHRRLSDMVKDINIPVYLWHGDAPQGQKNHMLREHDGIIMITPESLESFLMNRGEWCSAYMTPLVVVIDEFHAFLGEGRGKQMLSLLDRIDMMNMAAGKPAAARIALSATLSKLELVGQLLSPRSPFEIIDGTRAGSDEGIISVKTFEPPVKHEGQKTQKEDYVAMAKEIIANSVGEKTLTFAGSRMSVETIAATINDVCKADGIKSEAFPHHGSLAKDVREDLEQRLVSTDKPTMAVATVTLELGIDIGDIYEVFNVGATNSVASLRQRVGRSGRRDGIRRFECLVTGSRDPSDMEEELVTAIAEIELMEAGWFEPPNAKRKDISVLVSEILSVIQQYGSAYPEELESLLVANGAFHNVPEDLFAMVIEDMLLAGMLETIPGGQLVLGPTGEAEVGDWHFYAAFMTEESYSVRQGQKAIGEITPPSTSMLQLSQGGTFMLGGRYWQVQPPIDMKNRIINVKQVATRSKFLIPTSRGAGEVGGVVKRARINLLIGETSDYVPDYLDELGTEKLAQAREWAAIHHLNKLGISIYDGGEKGSETDSEALARASLGYSPAALLRISPPVDPPALAAIVKVLEAAGLEPGAFENVPMWRMTEVVEASLANWDAVVAGKEELLDHAMLEDLRNLEKYNQIFSTETLQYAYVDEKLDLDGAKRWMEAYMRFASQIG